MHLIVILLEIFLQLLLSSHSAKILEIQPQYLWMESYLPHHNEIDGEAIAAPNIVILVTLSTKSKFGYRNRYFSFDDLKNSSNIYFKSSIC